MNKNLVRLLHIQDAIADIEHYSETGSRDRITEDAIIRQLQVIGEACRKMDKAFQDENPGIPWRDIIGLRTILVHEYMQVDSSVIWSTISEHLPELKIEVETILKRYE